MLRKTSWWPLQVKCLRSAYPAPQAPIRLAIYTLHQQNAAAAWEISCASLGGKPVSLGSSTRFRLAGFSHLHAWADTTDACQSKDLLHGFIIFSIEKAALKNVISHAEDRLWNRPHKKCMLRKRCSGPSAYGFLHLSTCGPYKINAPRKRIGGHITLFSRKIQF